MYFYNFEFDSCFLGCFCDSHCCKLGCEYECICECINEEEFELDEIAVNVEIFLIIALYLTLVFSSFYYLDFIRSNLHNTIISLMFVFVFFPTFSRIVVIFDLNILEAIIRACIRIYQGFKIGLIEKTNKYQEDVKNEE